jgi:hypothetical protein
LPARVSTGSPNNFWVPSKAELGFATPLFYENGIFGFFAAFLTQKMKDATLELRAPRQPASCATKSR